MLARRRRRALLVGINSTRTGVYHDSPLAGCRADALGYRRLLLSRGWRDSEIVILYDEQATAAKWRDELAELRAAALAGAEVWHVVSGHGAELETGHGLVADVLCPSDFGWTAETSIGPDDLRWTFSGLSPDRVTVVLDTCHSGGLDGVRALVATRTGPTRVRGLGRRPGHGPAAHVRALASRLEVPVLAACGARQTAADVGPDGGAFSVALLRACKRSGVDASPIGDVVQLVATSLRRSGYAQRPEASGPCTRPLFAVAREAARA